jgi:HTH-type transcriptional regulator/antitoxin HipB
MTRPLTATPDSIARASDLVDVSGYVRRARRLADLSQRDLAAIVGIAQTSISRVESGQDLSVSDFARVLTAAGLRIAVVDAAGRQVAPMPPDVLRDRAGRRQPAHLDVHARPEIPNTRMLLRNADPIPRASWHHRRPERDRMRRRADQDATTEQLTLRAIAVAKAQRRTASTTASTTAWTTAWTTARAPNSAQRSP